MGHHPNFYDYAAAAAANYYGGGGGNEAYGTAYYGGNGIGNNINGIHCQSQQQQQPSFLQSQELLLPAGRADEKLLAEEPQLTNNGCLPSISACPSLHYQLLLPHLLVPLPATSLLPPPAQPPPPFCRPRPSARRKI